MTSSTLVCLCTYNEAKNLADLVAEVLGVIPDVQILIIDDNSPDGTGAIADSLAESNPRVHVLHRPCKMGLGTALVAAMQFAIANDYEKLLNLDADFSHQPRYLPAVRSGVPDVDVMIGSRYVAGGGVEGWGLKRHFMSRAINYTARLLLGLTTRDNSGSYRCYNVQLLKRLDFDLVRSRGYAIQEEILYRIRVAGGTFSETPIIFQDRRLGESKINQREMLAAVWILCCLFVDRLRGVRVTGEVSNVPGNPAKLDGAALAQPDSADLQRDASTDQ